MSKLKSQQCQSVVRKSVSIKKALYARAEKRAAKLGRKFSNYISFLLTEDGKSLRNGR